MGKHCACSTLWVSIYFQSLNLMQLLLLKRTCDIVTDKRVRTPRLAFEWCHRLMLDLL